MATLLAAPFINVLAAYGGSRWLAAYGVVAAIGATAAALAVALTVALFRTLGPKRTRLVAQIVAAVIGAAFVIGLQIAAILSYGDLSRFAVLESDWLVALAPGHRQHRVVAGARDARRSRSACRCAGRRPPRCSAPRSRSSPSRFGDHAMAAAERLLRRHAAAACVDAAFAPRPRCRRCGSKEWTLLRRDPWLVSQTLMQILYLLPPALFLWLTSGRRAAPMSWWCRCW